MPVCCDPALFKANIVYCIPTDRSEEDKIRCTMNGDTADRIESMEKQMTVAYYRTKRE